MWHKKLDSDGSVLELPTTKAKTPLQPPPAPPRPPNADVTPLPAMLNTWTEIYFTLRGT